jgi:tetratricopeptide (TPR) repeat protein
MASWKEIKQKADAAKILFKTNRKDALESFLDLLAKYPRDGMVHLRLAESYEDNYEQLGDYEKAEQHFSKAAEYLPEKDWQRTAKEGLSRIQGVISLKKSFDDSELHYKTETSNHTIEIKEDQKGISFEELFGPYLKNAKKIHIVDSYIREKYQIKNFSELISVIIKQKDLNEKIEVQLDTTEASDEKGKKKDQKECLEKIRNDVSPEGVDLILKFFEEKVLHDRYIDTDMGWRIVLGRGLDIFKHTEVKNSMLQASLLQTIRNCKPCIITFTKKDPAVSTLSTSSA